MADADRRTDFPSACARRLQAFSVFSCRKIGENSFVIDDLSVRCDTPEHGRMRALAAFWIVIFPIGVPVFFLGLLFKLKIPALAKRLLDDSWLRQVVKLAAQDGVTLVRPRTPRLATSLSTVRLVLRGYAISAERSSPSPSPPVNLRPPRYLDRNARVWAPKPSRAPPSALWTSRSFTWRTLAPDPVDSSSMTWRTG